MAFGTPTLIGSATTSSADPVAITNTGVPIPVGATLFVAGGSCGYTQTPCLATSAADNVNGAWTTNYASGAQEQDGSHEYSLGVFQFNQSAAVASGALTISVAQTVGAVGLDVIAWYQTGITASGTGIDQQASNSTNNSLTGNSVPQSITGALAGDFAFYVGSSYATGGSLTANSGTTLLSSLGASGGPPVLWVAYGTSLTSAGTNTYSVNVAGGASFMATWAAGYLPASSSAATPGYPFPARPLGPWQMLQLRRRRFVFPQYVPTNVHISVTASDALPALSDAPTENVSLGRTEADALPALSDSASRTQAQARTEADTLPGLSDSTSRQVSLFRSPADALQALSDVPGRVVALTRSVADSLPSISDVAVAGRVVVRGVADSLPALSDSIGRSLLLGRQVADTLPAMSDALSRALRLPRAVSDSLPGLVDGVSRGAQSFARTVADALPSVTDVAGAGRIVFISVADTLQPLSDSVSRSSQQFARTVADQLQALSDTPNRAINVARSVADALPGLSETPGRVVAVGRSVVDQLVALSDSVARRTLSSRALGDALPAIADGIVRAPQEFARSALDTLRQLVDAATAIIQRRPTIGTCGRGGFVADTCGTGGRIAYTCGAGGAVLDTCGTGGLANNLVVQRSYVGQTFPIANYGTQDVSNPIGPNPNYAGDGFRSSGQLVDPETVVLTVRDPSGEETVYTLASGDIVRDALGLYHYPCPLAQAGLLEWAWSSTGPQTYAPDSMEVSPDPI